MQDDMKLQAKKEALQELIKMMQELMIKTGESPMQEAIEESSESSEADGAMEALEEKAEGEGLDTEMPDVGFEDLIKREMKKSSKIPSKGKGKMVVGVSVKAAPVAGFQKKMKRFG